MGYLPLRETGPFTQIVERDLLDLSLRTNLNRRFAFRRLFASSSRKFRAMSLDLSLSMSGQALSYPG